jgi:hypothetical protein
MVLPLNRGEHSLKLIAEQSTRFCGSSGAGPRETKGPISIPSEPPVGGPSTSIPESIVLRSNEGLERGQLVACVFTQWKVQSRSYICWGSHKMNS